MKKPNPRAYADRGRQDADPARGLALRGYRKDGHPPKTKPRTAAIQGFEEDGKRREPNLRASIAKPRAPAGSCQASAPTAAGLAVKKPMSVRMVAPSKAYDLRFEFGGLVVCCTRHAIRRAERRGVSLSEVAARLLRLPEETRERARKRPRRFLAPGICAVAKRNPAGWTLITVWEVPLLQ